MSAPITEPPNRDTEDIRKCTSYTASKVGKYRPLVLCCGWKPHQKREINNRYIPLRTLKRFQENELRNTGKLHSPLSEQ
ncbi:hypothetical protein TNCV_3230311 [Trichonephila clavipes]|nr:hypothetical protein TNCV_3230311 [Trichonephila clavipes]